jgi:hypothetical protein
MITYATACVTSCLTFRTHASSPPFTCELLEVGTEPDSSLSFHIMKGRLLHTVSF